MAELWTQCFSKSVYQTDRIDKLRINIWKLINARFEHSHQQQQDVGTVSLQQTRLIIHSKEPSNSMFEIGQKWTMKMGSSI